MTNTMPSWQAHPILIRPDGSYVITHNGNPYHVPPEISEFAELWAEVDAFAKANPAQVMLEPGPPEPTLTEARTSKLSDIKSGYEAALIATLTMPASPENAPSSAETAAQAALFAAEDSAGLADVLAILSVRRTELEDAVNAAQTVEDVQAVAVSYPV